jgi:hypothetical protein
LLAAGQALPRHPRRDHTELDPEDQEEVRAIQATIAAITKVTRDKEDDVLEQYRVKGYAEVEVEDLNVEEGEQCAGDRFERME